MAGKAAGFQFTVARSGEVTNRHNGLPAATLRGAAAHKFLADVETADPQELMARVTGNDRRGNDRRGNERTARNHPRNARRSR